MGAPALTTSDPLRLHDHDLRTAAARFDVAMDHLLHHEAAPAVGYFGVRVVLRTAVGTATSRPATCCAGYPSMLRTAKRGGRPRRPSASTDAMIAGQHR